MNILRCVFGHKWKSEHERPHVRICQVCGREEWLMLGRVCKTLAWKKVRPLDPLP